MLGATRLEAFLKYELRQISTDKDQAATSPFNVSGWRDENIDQLAWVFFGDELAARVRERFG
jgi:hypothetical protein